jgi:hypothetical protein
VVGGSGGVEDVFMYLLVRFGGRSLCMYRFLGTFHHEYDSR